MASSSADRFVRLRVGISLVAEVGADILQVCSDTQYSQGAVVERVFARIQRNGVVMELDRYG